MELKCPKEFTGTLKKLWKYYASKENSEQIQKEDYQMLKQFIVATYQYNLLLDKFRVGGYNVFIDDKKGIPQENPILKPMRDAEKRVTALATELGFSPNARKKLKKIVEPKKPKVLEEDDLCD